MTNNTGTRNRSIKLLLLCFGIQVIFPWQLINAHQTSVQENPPALEKKGDPYMPVIKSSRKYSPAYKLSSPGFFTTQVNISAEGENIVGDAANEPSITYDPTNPMRMAIGWRYFETVSSNFRQAGVGYTEDGGETWVFDEIINEGVFRSDPVLDSDKEGNFYYNSLTVSNDDNYYVDIYKSDDGGANWDDGTFAYGGDKQWFTIDKTDGDGSGNIYHQWTSYYSSCAPNNFTRSVDAGFSYEDCSIIPGDPYWGTNTVDADGNLYACGKNGYDFIVAKSSGAQYGTSTMSWDLAADVYLGGYATSGGGYSSPNPGGLLGQADIAIDSSGGTYHNYVYLLCSVESFSSNDPCDVMFARSTDGGVTWSDPVRVNDDEEEDAYQWFGTMSVASDGRIDVVWLDTRDNPGDVMSKLYYAASWDAGETWSANIPLGESFDPHVGWPNQNKMGDYFDMFSTVEGAHLAWANTVNGEQDVYYAFISPEITSIQEPESVKQARLEQNYPNPFSKVTSLVIHLQEKESVKLEIIDITGRTVDVILDEELDAGRHRVSYEAGKLASGMYYCRMEAGSVVRTIKLLKE